MNIDEFLEQSRRRMTETLDRLTLIDGRVCDKGSRLPAKFMTRRVPGGWSVFLVVGTKRTGRTEEPAPVFCDLQPYTKAQAEVAAMNHAVDVWQALRLADAESKKAIA